MMMMLIIIMTITSNLTCHFVTIFTGIKNLAQVSHGIVDKRILSMFNARWKTAFNTFTNWWEFIVKSSV